MFAFAGARVIAVPGDEDGIDPAALEELVVRRPAQAALHRADLPEPDRPDHAGRAAGRRGGGRRRGPGLWIVEDDPYGELRFEGERVPWIASCPGAGGPYGPARLLLQGHGAGAAAGLAAGTGGAAARCAVAKQAADLHTPTVNQLAAARYLARPRPGRPRRAGRAASTARRRDAMLDGMRRRASGGLGLDPARGRHVPLGPAARRRTTPVRCAVGWWSVTWRTSRGALLRG